MKRSIDLEMRKQTNKTPQFQMKNKIAKTKFNLFLQEKKSERKKTRKNSSYQKYFTAATNKVTCLKKFKYKFPNQRLG